MSDTIGTDFGLVTAHWSEIESIDIYQKDHRKFGGPHGWKVPMDQVEAMLKAIELGADPETACKLVSMPYKKFVRWFAVGERIMEQVTEDREVELTDEQEGYLWLFRVVSHAEAMYLAKCFIVNHEIMAGNPNFTQLQSKKASEILAKRHPGAWERKSGVDFRDRRPGDNPPPAELPEANVGNEKIDAFDEEAIKERDKEVADLRRRAGTLGDLRKKEVKGE